MREKRPRVLQCSNVQRSGAFCAHWRQFLPRDARATHMHTHMDRQQAIMTWLVVRPSMTYRNSWTDWAAGVLGSRHTGCPRLDLSYRTCSGSRGKYPILKIHELL